LQDLSIPFNGQILAILNSYLAEAKTRASVGRIPTYIPRLAMVDPECLAIQVQPVVGPGVAIGAMEQPLALMSVVKPFVLLFLLEHKGRESVFARVGMMPSDQSFHAVSQLAADRGFPRNPMINSGAIALADQLPGQDGFSRCQTLCRWLNQRSGSNFYLDDEMLASVRSVGNETNRAIAGLMADAGYLDSIEMALDTYNHVCCLTGTIQDLARLGLLLAHPEAPIAITHQQIVNALMLTCGLYEASGQFAVQVGVPAKSGVSGALLAVVPRWGAIACYSPPLNEAGNSIAGLFLLEKLTRSLHLNIFG